MADSPTAVQQAVQRALSEALGSVQRQLTEVQSSFDTVKRAVESGQAGSDSFVGLLPSLLHMQASGASLAATVESVLRFIGASAQWSGVPAMAMPAAAPARRPAPPAAEPEAAVEVEPAVAAEPAESVHEISLDAAAEAPPAAVEAAPAPAARVDVSSLPDDLKQLHQKAKRFAKVTVQELIMYKKDEVTRGRENNDLYSRFKDEIDKSKQLYDKRFEKIAGHHIDYLYDELVRVLADNNADALGNYPYRPR
ncbi:MAG: hypothetical protein ACRD5I_08590 [Candidatus Acidiferrales bacterium]